MLYGKWISIVFSACKDTQGRLAIGYQNDIPWRNKIPSDMARFKDLTKEDSVGIGRITFWSIPDKFRPFDKSEPLGRSRQTIILTSDRHFKIDDPRVTIAHSLEEAAKVAKSNILWISGGGVLYAIALPFADYIHQTLINGIFLGDVYFPGYNPQDWENIFQEFHKAGGAKNPKDKFDTEYSVLKRKR
jgi:dihydrofolate reductase